MSFNDEEEYSELDEDKVLEDDFETAIAKMDKSKNQKVSYAQDEFNDEGVKIEPFSMRNEVRQGILTKDGVYKLTRERDSEVDLG